jgi:hypothetical protein
MAITPKVTTAGTLSLAQAEIDAMQLALNAHDRANFYLIYNAMTDSHEALLQASVATFSGNVGGVALAANRLGQVWGISSGYPGIYQQSQIVAQYTLDVINSDRLNADNAGKVSDVDLFQRGVLGAWACQPGAMQFFPGNVFQTSYATIGLFASRVTLEAGPLASTTPNPTAWMAATVEALKSYYNLGELASLLSFVVYDLFEKTVSNVNGAPFAGPSAHNLISTAEHVDLVDGFISDDALVTGAYGVITAQLEPEITVTKLR